jgi:Mu-like prophage protein gpG
MKALIANPGCAVSAVTYTLAGHFVLRIPRRVGLGDTVADWIHRAMPALFPGRSAALICRAVFLVLGNAAALKAHSLLRGVPCAACQRRRRILNTLFPYIRRDSLEYRAWNAYLASGQKSLPCLWDSETGQITPAGDTRKETPLSEKTVKRKGNAKLLYDTGKLRDSIRMDPPTANEVKVGTDATYSIYHQRGTSKMPARPFIPVLPSGKLTDQTARECGAAMEAAIIAGIK